MLVKMIKAYNRAMTVKHPGGLKRRLGSRFQSLSDVPFHFDSGFI